MERDDVIEYSLDAHHSEEEGVKKRKTIWKVTALLTIITAIEVGLGMYIKQGDYMAWYVVKWVFIALTILKAAFIVLSFMHLGDERKALKYAILIPYAVFIVYLMFIAFNEAIAVHGAM